MTVNDMASDSSVTQTGRPFVVIRQREVLRRKGGSKSTLYRDVKDGDFPEPIRLGKNQIGWLEHEVNEWLATRERGFLPANQEFQKGREKERQERKRSQETH